MSKLSKFRHVLTVSFHVAVPLLSRILPSDACKIYKQGLNIRQVLSTNVMHLNKLCDNSTAALLTTVHLVVKVNENSTLWKPN